MLFAAAPRARELEAEVLALVREEVGSAAATTAFAGGSAGTDLFLLFKFGVVDIVIVVIATLGVGVGSYSATVTTAAGGGVVCIRTTTTSS